MVLVSRLYVFCSSQAAMFWCSITAGRRSCPLGTRAQNTVAVVKVIIMVHIYRRKPSASLTIR